MESGQSTCNKAAIEWKKNIYKKQFSVKPTLCSQCHLEEVWLSHLFSQVGGGFALLSDALAATNSRVDFPQILIKTRQHH